MLKNNIEILMIGPGAGSNISGGVVSVIEGILEYLDKDLLVTYVVTMRPVGTLKRISIYFQALSNIVASVFNDRKKVAHIHLASRTSFYRKSLIILLLKLLNIPMLIHLHGGEFHIFYSEELNPLMQKYVRWIFGLADKTILLTKKWDEWYLETIKTSPSGIIYNGVRNYYNIESILIKDRKNIILYLGKLGKNKGIYDLLYSFKDVLVKMPDAILKICGDGEIEKCKQLAKDLEIENNVDFLGWVGEEEKYHLLNESKIYILPSYNEGLPMGLLEAMSAGLVVISTKVGGIPEAIDDKKSGLLIDAGNKAAITNTICDVLHNKYDVLEMGNKARKRYLKDFNIINITKKIENEYYELIR